MPVSMTHFIFIKMVINKSGFSLTPYLESLTPTFWLGAPFFQKIYSKLHCGTPNYGQRCLWDSYFQNASDSPVNIACVFFFLFDRIHVFFCYVVYLLG